MRSNLACRQVRHAAVPKVSLAGLHHAPDLDAIFAEMRRLVRPEGWVVIADVPAGERGGAIDEQALELESTIAGTIDHLRDLEDALAASPSQAGARRLAQLEAELRTHEAALRDLEEERHAVEWTRFERAQHRVC